MVKLLYKRRGHKSRGNGASSLYKTIISGASCLGGYQDVSENWELCREINNYCGLELKHQS